MERESQERARNKNCCWNCGANPGFSQNLPSLRKKSTSFPFADRPGMLWLQQQCNNKNHHTIFLFSYQSAEIIFIRKMKFPCIYIFTPYGRYFHCLGSYVHLILYTHFKPHSLKQLITHWTKLKDILQEDNHNIYFLYHRKVLSKRVVL